MGFEWNFDLGKFSESVLTATAKSGVNVLENYAMKELDIDYTQKAPAPAPPPPGPDAKAAVKPAADAPNPPNIVKGGIAPGNIEAAAGGPPSLSGVPTGVWYAGIAVLVIVGGAVAYKLVK